ncbi:hypothetical protein PUR34_08160 [Streptomyces sp. JV185]|uniref:hypothetical protein n=1 Tax=Streptomyces sp. JV185 TaxID=858638 RepID=UPI002E78759F|nr:hypothetical protein [Streptomyces sp. JV185]MEE1768152.1 hypothetical protein [Streptomyces sp. JV185]
MALDGPPVAYPDPADQLGHLATSRWIAGPPAYVVFPIVWGDTAYLSHGTVRYRRENKTDRDGMWLLRLRTDDPRPAGGRPPAHHCALDEGGLVTNAAPPPSKTSPSTSGSRPRPPKTRHWPLGSQFSRRRCRTRR